MGVWLDPRDGSGDLISYFPRGFAQLIKLDSADVMSTGFGPNGSIMWGMEIKKIGDVLQSLQNGRLVEQLGKMHEDYDWKFLLVEGEIRCHWDTGNLQHRVKKDTRGKKSEFWVDAIFGNKQKMSYEHFMSWLLSVTICSGTFLVMSADRTSTAASVVAMDRQLSKPWEQHSSLKVFNDSQGPGMFIPSIAMTTARNLATGMGWERAARAADYFGTARAMCNATEEQWREIDGIDKVLAKRAVEGANTPHVLRQRTRRKAEANGQSHSNLSTSPGNHQAKERRGTTRKVSRPSK